MDDLIYGDLENFNEVLDVRKIQDENEDLKSRMKKYAIEKQELQKEFDKLTLAFKNLERNYASLLKTARAEIERKTQMIVNLNKEKDKLVLNALQNKNILNIRDSNSNSKKEDSDSSIGKKKKETGDTQISNNFHKNDNQIVSNNSSSQKEINRQPSEDTSSYSSNLTNKSGSRDHNVPKYCQSYGDSKENIEQSKSKASSIRNRRKSMPTLSEAVPELWSEEEYDEQKQYANDKDIKYGPDKMAVSASNRFDRIVTDHKQMRESRREAAESRNTYSRPYDDRFKHRDEFEPTKRYRRWSPEFSRHRRQHGDDHYRHDKYYNSFGRYNNSRRRRLDGSPDNRSRSGDRRYKREREYNEFETKHQYQDKHAARNKLPSDNDEPPSKRTRTDSPSCQSKEEQRRKEWLPEYTNIREKEDENFMSCQSPDHLFSENSDNSASTHIKEIRNTASTRLEDPRTSSKKYSKEIINGQSTLCSVNSKNIELKLLRWDKTDNDNELNKPSLPEMLINRPENFTNKLEKEIFSEVNVEFSRSLESGEISDEKTNDLNISGKNAKNEDKKVTDIPKIGKVSGDFLSYKIPKKKSYNDKSLQGEKYSIEEKPVRSKRQSCINENIRHDNDTKVSFDTHEKSTIEDSKNSKKNNLETNLYNSKKSATEEEKLKSLRKSRTKLDKTVTKGDNKKIASPNTLETGLNNIEIERENYLETIPLKPNSIETILAVDEKLLQESFLPDEGIGISQVTNKKPVLFDTEESIKSKISNDEQHCSESNIVNPKQSITALGVEYDFILSDESSDAIEKSKNQDTINNKTETNTQEHTITSSNEVSNTVQSDDSMVAKKQSRKMTEKPHTMKIKFKNLFDDSGNLITPEDLEIPLEVQKEQDNITLFKGVGLETLNLDKNEIKHCDTQSEMFAVSEHNEVKNNIGSVREETQSKSGKTHTEKSDSGKRKRSRKNSEEKVSSKTKITGVEKKSKNLNTIKEKEYESKDDVKEIEKNLTENYCNIVIDQSAHIENIKAAYTKDSSVVKTVIISTGTQSTSEITSNITNLKGDTDNFKHIDSYLRQVTRMEALATSTPVKAFENTVSVSQSNSQTSCDDKSSVSSSVEEDIPDVRVFAFRNRRKKNIKKTPLCPPQTN